MSPRPKNIRKVGNTPVVTVFQPLLEGQQEPEQTVCLHYEEYEAIRLCDYEQMTQQEACTLMEVSRPTLSRIYTRARQKIAQALIEGAQLVIEGGTAYTTSRWFTCQSCGLSFNNIHPSAEAKGVVCPRCHTSQLIEGEENKNFKINKVMIKIAVPTRNNMVDNHFGHCEFYTIFTIGQENQILSTETIPSPQGCGCKSNIAGQLEEMGVSVMLAGSMGAGALNVLTSHHIKVFRGCSGNVMELVATYLKGGIQDSGEGCHHHEGEGHQCQHHHHD